MNEQTVVYSCSGILYSNEDKLQLHATIWAILTDIMLNKREKQYVLCDYIYIKFKKSNKMNLLYWKSGEWLPTEGL